MDHDDAVLLEFQRQYVAGAGEEGGVKKGARRGETRRKELNVKTAEEEKSTAETYFAETIKGFAEDPLETSSVAFVVVSNRILVVVGCVVVVPRLLELR